MCCFLHPPIQQSTDDAGQVCHQCPDMHCHVNIRFLHPSIPLALPVWTPSVQSYLPINHQPTYVLTYSVVSVCGYARGERVRIDGLWWVDVFWASGSLNGWVRVVGEGTVTLAAERCLSRGRVDDWTSELHVCAGKRWSVGWFVGGILYEPQISHPEGRHQAGRAERKVPRLDKDALGF